MPEAPTEGNGSPVPIGGEIRVGFRNLVPWPCTGADEGLHLVVGGEDKAGVIRP